jgi:hypothetical protein
MISVTRLLIVEDVVASLRFAFCACVVSNLCFPENYVQKKLFSSSPAR